MDIIERRAQIGKVDAFKADVSIWLGSEEISTASIVTDDLLTVSATTNDANGVSFIASGVSVGLSKVKITVNTATRSRCFDVGIKVVQGC